MKTNLIDSVLTAAQYGKFEIVRKLLGQREEGQITSDVSPAVLGWAASHRNLTAIKWLILDSGLQPDLSADDHQLSLTLAYAGNTEILDWFVKELPAELEKRQLPKQVLKFNAKTNEAIHTAAYRGELRTVKWLVLESEQSVNFTLNNYAPLRSAAHAGHLEVLQWLVESAPVEIAELNLKRNIGGLPKLRQHIVDCQKLVESKQWHRETPEQLCREYLEQVAELQSLVGMEVWLQSLKTDKLKRGKRL